MYGRAGPLVRQPIRRAQYGAPSLAGRDMTPEALALARDGDAAATPAAVALWRAIVGHGSDGDADYVKRKVKPAQAGAALDEASAYVGSTVDVPDYTLGEAVFRDGSYLQKSGALLGFHGSTGEGMPDADPARGGYSSLRRSGAMALLEPYRSHRAGLV